MMYTPNSSCAPLEALPSEIIHHICGLLPPLSLAMLARTSKLLRSFADVDLHWARFFRQNVPNHHRVHSPSPYASWKELYTLYRPFWFLTRRRIWFTDRRHTGSLLIVLYNPRSACIEGYRLVTRRDSSHLDAWEDNPDVYIHYFHPKVQLWLERPVFRLKRSLPRAPYNARYDVPLLKDNEIKSSLFRCRPIPRSLQTTRMALWPPITIPASQRAVNQSSTAFRDKAHKPRSLADASDSMFRIRKWVQEQLRTAILDDEVTTFSTLSEEFYTPTEEKPWQGIWVGDYSVHGCEFMLLLQREVASTPNVEPAPPNTSHTGTSLETSSGASNCTDDEAQGEDTKSEQDSMHYGRLEAIKLTGDAHVPRGEYSWIADDIGPKGLIRVATDQQFKGARIVRSRGHIAGLYFQEGWPFSNRELMFN